MELRRDLLRLAHEVPATRRHLVPILRLAASYPEYVKRKKGEGEQPLSQEDWERRVQGVPDEKSPEKQKAPDEKNPDSEKGAPAPSFKERVMSLIGKLKPHPKVVQAVKSAPAHVQRILVDSEHRAKVLKGMATGLKKSPQTVMSHVWKGAKAELKELKHAGKAFRKGVGCKFKCLNKEDKSAMYSAGVYVAGVTLAMVPPGTALAAAGALGTSFAAHIGLKAVHGLIDSGFLHFEAFETGYSVLNHIIGVVQHIVGKKTERDSDEELMLAALTGYIIKEIEKGLTDGDIEKILKTDPNAKPAL